MQGTKVPLHAVTREHQTQSSKATCARNNEAKLHVHEMEHFIELRSFAS